MMPTRRLGSTGLEVSLVGLGCNNFGGRIDTEATRRVVDAAIDHGITLFDTSDSYGIASGSEKALGEVLGARRNHVVLATKFASPLVAGRSRYEASRSYIMRAVEDSLRRLRTDWIDLYQLHFPDKQTPIEETLRALDDLVRAGKVRYIGCSNLPAWQVTEAHWTARTEHLHRFACTQAEYSLLNRRAEAELLPALAACSMGLLPYFPLASGLLSGKYRRGAEIPPGSRMESANFRNRHMTDRNQAVAEELRDFAERHGHSLLELAFSWLAAQPAVSSVIAGATRPEQITANVGAIGWQLSPAELAAVDRITTEHPG